MTLKEELEAFCSTTFREAWDTREGRVVPNDDSLPLKNVGVKFDEATVLYADLTDSTGLVSGKLDAFAAEVYKTYLYCSTRIIRSHGGTITAYDGDRVMAVFLGDSKNSDAVKAALQIEAAASQIIQPALKSVYTDSTYRVLQKVGVDTSSLLVAKTGARGANDLVWVGNAANHAAKLATLAHGYSTYIGESVYGRLRGDVKYKDPATQATNMWVDLGTSEFGFRVYGSGYRWNL